MYVFGDIKTPFLRKLEEPRPNTFIQNKEVGSKNIQIRGQRKRERKRGTGTLPEATTRFVSIEQITGEYDLILLYARISLLKFERTLLIEG